MTLEYGDKNDDDLITTVIQIRVSNKKFLKALAGINGNSMKKQLDNLLSEQRMKFDEKVEEFKE